MSADARVLLASTGHDLLFTHAALWGAGMIASAVHTDVRAEWTGELTKTPALDGVDALQLAVAVRDRATEALRSGHWMQAGLPHEPNRGLFSPRIKTLPDPSAWAPLHEARQGRVDELAESDARLDLRLLAALGEPSSWHHDRGQPRQDRGASRLEMQPRNQGSEFVGTRLRSLAAAVAARSVEQVRDGLTGALRLDEAGGDRPDSRSAANLMPPRVTDNALAWSAMWGLACAPVVHRVHMPSRTATHLPWTREGGLGAEVRAGHVVLPFWTGRWTTARLVSVLASQHLLATGEAVLARHPAAEAPGAPWLREHGVTGLAVVPIHTFGSTSSPERRAMAGKTVSLVARS